ncbi:MAG: hydrolase [Rhodocyclaceae bacterium]
MLIDRSNSTLLVVDIQERLLMHIDGWQSLVEHTLWLMRLAKRLEVPVIASEQYPKGLGHTHGEVAALLPAGTIGEKLHFSCAAAECLADLPGAERRQVVIVGMETHVCVLQTALDLHWQGKEVFLVAEAVGSRRASDKDLALARMRGHGIEIVSREMVAFEWLRRAGTDEFRAVSTEFLR